MRRIRSASFDDSGFALVTAIALSFAIASLLLLLMSSIKSLSEQASTTSAEIQLRAHLEAALERMLFAYKSADDPLRARLTPDGQTVDWSFDGRDYLLSVRAESGKWDLNAGQASQIRKLLNRVVLEPDTRSIIFANIEKARALRQRIVNVADVLPALDKMTDTKETIERYFTTLTDQKGIDPLSADDLTLICISNLLPGTHRAWREGDRSGAMRANLLASDDAAHFWVQQQPIYSFHAETKTGSGVRRAGMTALAKLGEHGEVKIYTWSFVTLPVPRAVNDAPNCEATASAILSPP